MTPWTSKFRNVILTFFLAFPGVMLGEDYSHYFSVAREADGDVIPSATVSVYAAGTMDLAVISSDITGTSKGNPFLTDVTGNYFFFAEPGLYKVIVTKIAVGTFTTDYISIGTQLHGDTHGDGGADEVDVNGLSGQLTDPQKITLEIDSVEEGDYDTLDFVPSDSIEFGVTGESSESIVAFVVEDGVTSTEISDGAVTTSEILNGTVVNADISNSAAIAESKLSLTFATHSNANDPTAGQKAALAGTFGTPGGANQYVTTTDSRMSNARTPTSHATSHESGGGDELEIATTQLTGIHAGTNITTDLEEETHATEHQNGGADEISVAGLSGELADPQNTGIYENGVLVASQPAINFTEGAGTTLTVTDDPGNNRVIVNVASLGYLGVLNGLIDVDTTGVATGEALVYDGANWVPSDETVCLSNTTNCPDPTPDDLSDNSIDDLNDVTTAGATDGHGLVFDTGDLVVSDDPLCLLDGTNCPTISLDEVGSGTSAVALTIGTGGSLGVSGSGTIAATTSVALASIPIKCAGGNGAGGVAANGDAVDCGEFDQDDLSDNTFADLDEVDIDAVSTGESLVWDGTSWVDTPVCSGYGCTIGSGASFSGGLISNEAGADLDTRIEGDTLTHMVVTDASAATENIGLLSGSMPNWQSMDRGIFVGQATTVPTGNPSDGMFLWTADTVAGQTNLYARNENGKVEQLTGLVDATSAQFDVTTSVTPVAVTGLSHSLEAGKRYKFEVRLHCTDTASGGARVSMGGTATATAIIYQTEIYRASNMSIQAAGRHTSLLGVTTAAPPVPYVVITGYIQVNVAGTLTPMFAQDTSAGTSSVLVGSTFEITPIGD